MKLEELRVYQLSMKLGEEIWQIVSNWNYFEKDTIGKQFIRSADSIGANLSEGFGRFHYNESRNFYYYSRGSLYETKTWLTKSLKRKLITENDYRKLIEQLEILGALINNYIKTVGPR